jgi:hypothetical protein
MATPEKQLNNLKRIKPDNSWKQENRRVLYSQISNSYAEQQQSLAERIREAFIGLRDSLSKPAWAVVIIATLVITGGLGAQATHYSKPGDTFYFTKKITEKLKLALTFDKQEKAKMSIQFSSGHARDITETLSDPSFDKESAGELQNNFREELMSVRRELDTIAMSDKEEKEGRKQEQEQDKDKESAQSSEQTDNNRQEGRAEPEERSEPMTTSGEQHSEEKRDAKAGEEQNNKDEQEDQEGQEGNEDIGAGEQLAEGSQSEATDTDDSSMFIMDFGKQENGQDIYIPEQDEQGEAGEGGEVHRQMEEAGRKLEDNKEEMDNGALPELYTLLDKAGEQFDQGNYERAKELLDEFTEKFNNLQKENKNEDGDNGEVKGVSEEATSTDSGEEKENSTSTEEEK